MKVKLGTNLGVTINIGDYQNIKVDTTIEIEKDIDEDQIEEEQNKVYNMAEKDLQNKIRKSYKDFYNFKDKLKSISKS
jgi:hypothetical protein